MSKTAHFGEEKNLSLLAGIEPQILLHTCEAGIYVLYPVYVGMTDFINFDLSLKAKQ